jgi:transposase
VSLPNQPRAVAKLFSRWKRESGNRLLVCYEAGSVGFVLYRQLRELGIDCEVIAPALIPKRAGDRIKTDRRDAQKLLRLYLAGELTPIRVPTPEAEAVRDLARARRDARKDLVAARQRLSKFLIRHGRIWSAGSPWTQRHYRWLREQKFDQAAEQITFDYYLSQVAHLIDCRKNLRLRTLRQRRAVRHFHRARPERTFEWLPDCSGRDHEDRERPRAASAHRGVLVVPAATGREQKIAEGF